MIEPVYKRFGEKLKAARIKRSLSQCAIAKIAGVSRPTAINIEKGRFRCSLHLALKIARFLDINLIEIADRELSEGEIRFNEIQRLKSERDKINCQLKEIEAK